MKQPVGKENIVIGRQKMSSPKIDREKREKINFPIKIDIKKEMEQMTTWSDGYLMRAPRLDFSEI